MPTPLPSPKVTPSVKSIAEPDEVPTVKRLLKLAADPEVNTQILIPEEVVVSHDLESADHVWTVALAVVGADDYIVDASPAYAAKLKSVIGEYLDPDGACTVIWNGPLGVTEVPEFRDGSQKSHGRSHSRSQGSQHRRWGDTASFVDEAGLHDKFTWVSTGGGASLELMSGQGLPCVDALLDHP
ncbi:phosphoglycerate kinase [bacterium]|nr:MAG: phosphoglycerate kinase [bacterium]